MDISNDLHRARVARGLDLSRVCAITALSPRIVRAIDEGRYAQLPGGLYARSYVRAFAEAVGVAPDAALREVELLLPPAPDPLPTLRDQTGPSPVEWLGRQARTQVARVRSLARRADLPRFGGHGFDLRRAAAAILDALVLVSVGTVTTALTAWQCGVGFVEVLDQAGLALAAMLSAPVLLYFVLFQGIGGRTPGARACRLAPREEPGKLSLDMIATRAFRT